MRYLVIVTLILNGLWAAPASTNKSTVRSLWKKPAPKKKVSVKTLWKKPARSSKAAAKPASRKPTRKASTVARIRDSKNTLEQTLSEREQMNQQLDKIARAIRKTELERIAIDKVLARLEKEQRKTQSRYQVAKRSIDAYGGKISKLDRTIQQRHEDFVRLLADRFAIIAALEAIDRPTEEAVVRQEVFEVYKQQNRQELIKLKQAIDGSRKSRKELLARQKAIRKSIEAITAKRELYRKKKEEKESLLALLAQKEKDYRSRLKAIMQRQEMLRQTLAKLNILRKEEIARAKAEERARREELARKAEQLKQMRAAEDARIREARAKGEEATYVAPRITEAPQAAKKVKQYGSSYQASNIKKYRGPRTISPLKHARVIKRFGTYVDPIYKIKIFNDNVVLRSPVEGAKVRNVLNGKVVYIGSNSMLGKVVIIEHGNRLHTIYAALDRIAPLLKTGSRVKKGAVIGRVKHKLIFQATQNSKYINPLRLIRL